jgi:RNA polymerase sigma-32 factor
VKPRKPKPEKKASVPAVVESSEVLELDEVELPQKPAKSTSTSLTQTDPLLASYLKEIQRYPLLSREEEHATAVHYHEHKDRDSLQKLITSNLRFVVKIAFEYVHYRTKLLDLIQEGNMGLVRAVQDFNPYKDVRLTTYAVWWIRSYIQDYLLKNHSLVKIGTTQAQKRLFYRLRAEQKKLEQLGISPGESVKLLAGKLDVREKDIREMDQRLSHNEVSLNVPEFRDDKTEAIQNLADPISPVDERLGDDEQKAIFHSILVRFSKTLEGREKVIFQERLISENPLTLQELGTKYGVTKERARQIEEQVKSRLKAFVEAEYPDFKLLSAVTSAEPSED